MVLFLVLLDQPYADRGIRNSQMDQK